MVKSESGTYYRRSAYQFAYLGIFALTIYQMATSTLRSENPVSLQMLKLSQKIEDAVGDVWIIEFLMLIPQLFLILFVVAFCVHLVRIYITLEFMDDGEWDYKIYFDSYGAGGRLIDFVIRAIIIVIVCAKVIEVKAFNGLPIFVLAFYVALVFWTLNAMIFGKKNLKDSFGISSFSGLAMAIALFFLSNAKGEAQWQLLALLFAVFGLVLTFDLIRFLIHNSIDIVKIYRGKIFKAW